MRRRYKSAPAVDGEDIKGHMVMVEKREWVDRKLAPIINVVLVHRREEAVGQILKYIFF